MRETTLMTVATVIFGILMVALGVMLFSSSDDKTCPEYGYVPVLLDGEQTCVPWEKASELQDILGGDQ